MTIEGLWIPLITPFHDGDLDETSLRRLGTQLEGVGADVLQQLQHRCVDQLAEGRAKAFVSGYANAAAG